MSLVMENLLEEIYAGTDVPYWGDAIPVSVVRTLIAKAELRATCNALDVIEKHLDAYVALGFKDKADALNLVYQRVNEQDLEGENK